MHAPILNIVSVEDYLALDANSPTKYEYSHGVIIAMSGASERHNSIAGAIGGELYQRLKRGRCKVYPGDMRVQSGDSSGYFYPDVVVMCGRPQLVTIQGVDTLLNPTIIVEVLSDSTMAYDRDAKFRHYQTIASLQEYLLVNQYEARVEHYHRQGDNLWLYGRFEGLDAEVALPSIQQTLTLREIYEQVEVEDEDIA